jgi:hypothetical protein
MSKHKKKEHYGKEHYGKEHHGNKDHHRPNQHAAEQAGANKKWVHHDWKFWVAIVLMLLGIFAYVMTMDDSLRPGGGQQPEVPAVAE